MKTKVRRRIRQGVGSLAAGLSLFMFAGCSDFLKDRQVVQIAGAHAAQSIPVTIAAIRLTGVSSPEHRPAKPQCANGEDRSSVLSCPRR